MRRINTIRKHVPGMVLSLTIVAVLLCACGKTQADINHPTVDSGTPVADQSVPALTVGAKEVDTPTVVVPMAEATSTLTSVQQTNTPVAAHTPTPTGTPGPIGTPTGTPPPTSTPESVIYVVRAGDSLAAIAQAYGVTVAAIAEANGIQDVNAIHVGQELLIPDPARIPAGPIVQPPALAGDGGQAAATPLPSLEQLADTDPGPPFTVEVSLNRATQDPLVEQSRRYKVTGIVRNDGDRPYAVSAIHVTFFDASGFRGRFKKFPQPWEQGGEWRRHGETEAEFAALFLAPGEEWPFSVEITAQDMASFVIHPDAAPSDREPAAVALSEVQVVDAGPNYVRISGTATNVSSFKVKNVIVSSVLLDAGGRIVSSGSSFGLEEDIAPGAAVRFDLRVAREPYTGYRLYAQAERDWD